VVRLERPSKVADRCDRCDGKLFQREDDRPESITVRLEAYEQSTAPWIAFCQKLCLLIDVEAKGSPEEICNRTLRKVQPCAVHQFLQGLGLSQSSRKSIENEPVIALQAAESLPDDLPHGRIRHQGATPHVLQGLLHSGTECAAAAASRGSENGARGEMARANSLVQQVGLGTFSHARCSQEHKPPGVSESADTLSQRTPDPCSQVTRSFWLCDFILHRVSHRKAPGCDRNHNRGLPEAQKTRRSRMARSCPHPPGVCHCHHVPARATYEGR
jgi:hypothetical protein